MHIASSIDPALFRHVAPLLAFGGCTVLFLYVIAPLIVKAKNWMPARPVFEPFDLGELPPAIGGAFQEAARQLAALGFVAVGHVSRRDPQLNSELRISIWSHPQDKNVCQVIAVRTTTRLATLVTFRQEYRNGEAVVTNNMTSPGVFPTDARQESVTCSGVNELALLYRLHRARVAALSQRRAPQVPAIGQAAQYMAADWARSFERVCDAGYFELAPEGERFVKTTKGAYIMTWRLLWPWKQLRLAARDRRADAELRKYGLPSLAQCRAGTPGAPMQTA